MTDCGPNKDFGTELREARPKTKKVSLKTDLGQSDKPFHGSWWIHSYTHNMWQVKAELV